MVAGRAPSPRPARRERDGRHPLLVPSARCPTRRAAPPGADTFLKILNWAAWIATAPAVSGVFVDDGTMAMQHQHGGSGEYGESSRG